LCCNKKLKEKKLDTKKIAQNDLAQEICSKNYFGFQCLVNFPMRKQISLPAK
jgi:hypothetical protein